MNAEPGPPEVARQATPTPGAEAGGVKLAIDFAPLLIFFAVYVATDIYWATGVLMAAIVASVVASRVLLGRVSVTLMVTAGLILAFGTLTLALHDPRFIKMKPTLVNLILSAALFLGLWLQKPFLQLLLSNSLRLTDAGWRGLTIRWALFFLVLAGLNEVVWRTFSEPAWVRFKVFGILGLTVLFVVTQVPFIRRHSLPGD